MFWIYSDDALFKVRHALSSPKNQLLEQSRLWRSSRGSCSSSASLASARFTRALGQKAQPSRSAIVSSRDGSTEESGTPNVDHVSKNFMPAQGMRSTAWSGGIMFSH